MLRIIVLLCLGVLSALAWGFGPPKELPPTAVELFDVVATTSSQTIDAVGKLRADQAVILKPEISARVENFHFEEGKPVKQGEILISLDAASAQAQLKEAQANLTLTNLNLKRLQELFVKKMVSANDRDTLLAKQKVDEAKVAAAEAAIQKAYISAPFDGVAGLREVNIGEVVSPGQALVSVVALNPMKIDFRVPEVDLSRLAVDQKVYLSVKAFPEQTFEGRVIAIDPYIDEQTHSVAVRAVVDNKDELLYPGLFAQVKLEVKKQANVLMIPEQAIVPEGKTQQVYVVKEGVAKLVVVEVGSRRNGEVEILKGLEVGDRIVTAGQIKLHDGAKVVDVAQSTSATP